MIPALVIYRLFPDTKISANGTLSKWDVKTTGAFAGYIITVVLGYFLVQNTHQLIAQIGNPYWNITAKVELQNEDGTPHNGGNLVDTLEVFIAPQIQRVKYGTAHLIIPGHRKDWKKTDLKFEVAGYGYKTVNLRDITKDANIDPYNLSVELLKPIVIKMDRQIVDGYNLDNATPLAPAIDGSGPALK
jgi:hypothetical protein